jgi:CRP-like cAMP-binding protein
MLCGRPYVGEVVAQTEVSALRLPQDLFFELLETIPDFSVALARDLASRLYRLADFVLHNEKVH